MNTYAGAAYDTVTALCCMKTESVNTCVMNLFFLFFDGSCMSHVNASVVVTEPRNIHTLNKSSFDRRYGKGTLNSFDFLIVSK